MRPHARGAVRVLSADQYPAAELRASSSEQTRARGSQVVVCSLQLGSECPLVGVVSRPIMRLIRTSRRRIGQVHPQLPEFRIRIALGWIVSQQIPRPQLVTDLAEGVRSEERR